MIEKVITSDMRRGFEVHLRQEERSRATVEKYLRDLECFRRYAAGQSVSKVLTMQYKAYLATKYAVTSVNSMIAAMNAFLKYAGWNDCCVKQFKLQRDAYCPAAKELTKPEYERLIRAAERRRDRQLSLMIQTICSTGIRVSELQAITVEAIKSGEAIVRCKGKTRRIFIVKTLRKKLAEFCRVRGITDGAVFITRRGMPVSRVTVWRRMKQLCEAARVSTEKVFPHNLRHLFAREFYSQEKDIAKLVDVLGHASINTTRLYIITTGAEHRKKLERLRLVM